METLLSLITVALLGYQTALMPERLNAKWTVITDRNGDIILMNTQTGEMTRCDDQLRCKDLAEPKSTTP